MKVKLENGFAKVEVNTGEWIVCNLLNGEYSLSYKCESGSYMYHKELVSNKKRISTINKTASEYGIEFVA